MHIKGGDGTGVGNTNAVHEAASAPLTIFPICGLILLVVNALYTPNMPSALSVDLSLCTASGSYIYWSGAVFWATLTQAVSLLTLLATRDAWTPIKIIAIAAVVNILGNVALYVWSLQWGCTGAVTAKAGATLMSRGFMVRILKQNNWLPSICIPSKEELGSLMEYTRPLLAGN